MLKNHWFIHISVQKIFYLLRSKQSGAHRLFRLGATKKTAPLASKTVWHEILLRDMIFAYHWTSYFLDTKISKKLQKAKTIFEGQTQSPKPKISKFYNFFSSYGSYGVILVGKTIDLSLKAIKTIGGPDIGQLSKVSRRMWINVISLFQC